MKNCPEKQLLFERMLESDLPGAASAQDQQHLEQCETCRRQFERFASLEARLGAYPQEVVDHIAARPILPADVCRPVKSSGSPRNMIVLGIVALATLLLLLAYGSRNSLPGADPAINHEEQPAIQLPRNFIVKNHLHLKQNSRTSFTADQAYITDESGVNLRFTNADFTFVPSGIELNAGKIDVEIAAKGLEFAVTTFNAVIAVKGTIFAVEVKSDKSTVVTVTRGKVEVVNIAGDKTSLIRGESSIIAQDGAMQKSLARHDKMESLPANLKDKEETASAQQMLNE